MSVMGTGGAASVAQVSLQAQQVGRLQARVARDRANAQQRVQKLGEKRVKRLDVDDTDADHATLHVEGELSEQAARQATQQESPSEPGDEVVAEQHDLEAKGVASVEPAQPSVYSPAAASVKKTAETHSHRLDVQA